jgi:hypothetical protein
MGQGETSPQWFEIILALCKEAGMFCSKGDPMSKTFLLVVIAILSIPTASFAEAKPEAPINGVDRSSVAFAVGGGFQFSGQTGIGTMAYLRLDDLFWLVPYASVGYLASSGRKDVGGGGGLMLAAGTNHKVVFSAGYGMWELQDSATTNHTVYAFSTGFGYEYMSDPGRFFIRPMIGISVPSIRPLPDSPTWGPDFSIGIGSKFF